MSTSTASHDGRRASKWIVTAMALVAGALVPACGDEPGTAIPGPDGAGGAGGTGNAPLTSPLRTPRFDVEGARFDDPGVQARIEELIKEACPDGTVCLEYTAKVDEGTQGGSDDSCRIVGLPPAGREVEPGDTLVFLINQPCEGEETGEPSGETTPEPAESSTEGTG